MLGFLIIVEGIFMLLASSVDFFYVKNLNELIHNNRGFTALLLSGAITIGFGLIFYLIGFRSSKEVGVREGYSIVSLVWIFFSLFGMLPFLLSGVTGNITDAFFESMSGFTTTGSSVLADIEVLPHSMLFWRSLTQWLGGMGIVVLSLAILPFLGVSPQLFTAEASGTNVNKLSPQIKDTARRLWGLYAVLTLILAGLLYIEDMGIFDAINHALTTLASGGYSTKNNGILYWNSPLIHYTLIFFMFIAGVSFTLLYFAFAKMQFSKLFKDEEFKTYFFVLLITAFLILIIISLTSNPINSVSDLERNFRDSLFQVTAVISSSGFYIADHTQWIPLAWILILLLKFSGGMAGSTSGGMKMIRIVIMFKNCVYELKRLLHPNAVIPLRINKKVLNDTVAVNVYAFMFLFMMLLLVGFLALILAQMPVKEAFVTSLSCISNIGMSIGEFGLEGNYALATVPAKWIMSFLMLIGRLEIFTVVLLFSRDLWRK
jgi:trk system potassium uptake protein TrkH